jgi:hypothetical protein
VEEPSPAKTPSDESSLGVSVTPEAVKPRAWSSRPRHGTPIEPRNFGRSSDRCIVAARVPRITVRGTRKTCASLLAALDIHPRVAIRILRHSKIVVTMEICTEAPAAAISGRVTVGYGERRFGDERAAGLTPT